MNCTAVTLDDYGEFETAWCPGCGNFSILKAVKNALVASALAPHQVIFVSGIGQAAKAPHYLRAHSSTGSTAGHCRWPPASVSPTRRSR